MRRRLTLITEIIAPYRVPVFNELAAREDIELHVIFLSDSDPTLREWLVPLDELRFNYQVLPFLRRRIGGYHLLVNWQLARALGASRPDVVVCGGYNYLASWRAAYWARRRRIPFLLWFESTEADQRGSRTFVEALKRKFLALSSGFVVPGSSSAAYLKLLGIGEQIIFTAPNAVDNELFSEGAKLARKNETNLRRSHGLPERFLLCVARLVEAKGVFEVLEAYAKLDESLRSLVGLVYVGEGSARAELEKVASQITSGEVRFAGFIQKDRLPTYYALSVGLVLPTHSDTWGLVVNEAMACGTAVIATEVAGCVRDLIEDGCNGLVVPARDPEKLASAMQRLIVDAEWRTRMGERCSEKIANFSPFHCAAGIARAAIAARFR